MNNREETRGKRREQKTAKENRNGETKSRNRNEGRKWGEKESGEGKETGMGRSREWEYKCGEQRIIWHSASGNLEEEKEEMT